MARYERFTFLCNDREKEAIVKLAAQLSRSQSDAVRFVIVEVAKQLIQADPAQPDIDPKQSKGGSNAITA